MEKEGVVSALSFLGLSKMESSIYIFICSNPEATAGRIIKTLRIARSKTYDAINKLMSMGLISKVSHGGVSRYFSSGTSILKGTYTSRVKEVGEAIEYINTVAATNPEETKVQVLEGIDGYMMLKESFLETMNRGEELMIIGSPRRRPQQLDKYLERFHSERSRRGIKLRLIHTRDVDRRRISRKSKGKFLQIRFLREGISPAWIEIYGNNLIIPFFSQKVISIAITDNDIAESFRMYFDTLWNSFTLRRVSDEVPSDWTIFRNFFDASPIPFLILDSNGKFRQANASWHGLLGHPREDMSGYSPLQDAIMIKTGLDKLIQKCIKTRKTLISPPIAYKSLEIPVKKGSTQHIELVVYPELPGKKKTDFFLIFQNIPSKPSSQQKE